MIIINDGGSDDLLQLLDTIHDPRLRYIKLEKSLGVSVARNHGLEIAVGKYIAYLDDDDIFYPDHITTLIDLIEKTNSDFVYSNCKRTYGEYKNSEFVINCSIIPWQPANFDIKKLLKGNYISTLSVLHKRELIFNIGCFNIDIRYCEDWDLWVRIACSYKIRSTSKITGEYRFRVQSNAEKNTSIRNKNLMNFYDKLLSESYSFLFYYYDLYFYFEKNNKFKESLFYQNRIIELLCGGFYSFNKHQLMIIESVLRKNYPPIPKQKKIVLYAKLIQLKILQNAIYVIKRVNKLYNQNIGWRLKKRKIKYV